MAPALDASELGSETVPSSSLTNLNRDKKNFQTRNQPKSNQMIFIEYKGFEKIF